MPCFSNIKIYQSCLPSNNGFLVLLFFINVKDCYKKLDLNSQLKNENNLLY